MKHFITLSLLLTLSINLWGQDTWVKTFGGKGGEVKGESIISTSDGGVLITGPFWETKGDFKGMEKGGTDVFVIKLDKDGEFVWKKVHGCPDLDEANDVTVTSDDGMLIVGLVSELVELVDGLGNGEESYESDIKLFKLDKDGDKLWERSFGGKGKKEGGSSITTTPDGHILITGTTDSNDGDFKGMNKGYTDVFVMKLDSNGNLKPSGKKKSKKK